MFEVSTNAQEIYKDATPRLIALDFQKVKKAEDLAAGVKMDAHKATVTACCVAGMSAIEAGNLYINGFMGHLGMVEDEVKDLFGKKGKSGKMIAPTWWRTRKSAIEKALDAGMNAGTLVGFLLDENGDPMGKTAAELAVKKKLSPFERCIRSTDTLGKYWGELTTEERSAVRTTIPDEVTHDLLEQVLE